MRQTIECLWEISQKGTKNIFGVNCFLPFLQHGKKTKLGIEFLSKATLVLIQKLIRERCWWFPKILEMTGRILAGRCFSLETETLWIKCVSNSRYTWMIMKFYYCFQSKMRNALCKKLHVFEFRNFKEFYYARKHYENLQSRIYIASLVHFAC